MPWNYRFRAFRVRTKWLHRINVTATKIKLSHLRPSKRTADYEKNSIHIGHSTEKKHITIRIQFAVTDYTSLNSLFNATLNATETKLTYHAFVCDNMVCIFLLWTWEPHFFSLVAVLCLIQWQDQRCLYAFAIHFQCLIANSVKLFVSLFAVLFSRKSEIFCYHIQMECAERHIKLSNTFIRTNRCQYDFP